MEGEDEEGRGEDKEFWNSRIPKVWPCPPLLQGIPSGKSFFGHSELPWGFGGRRRRTGTTLGSISIQTGNCGGSRGPPRGCEHRELQEGPRPSKHPPGSPSPALNFGGTLRAVTSLPGSRKSHSASKKNPKKGVRLLSHPSQHPWGGSSPLLLSLELSSVFQNTSGGGEREAAPFPAVSHLLPASMRNF